MGARQFWMRKKENGQPDRRPASHVFDAQERNGRPARPLFASHHLARRFRFRFRHFRLWDVAADPVKGAGLSPWCSLLIAQPSVQLAITSSLHKKKKYSALI